MKKYWKVVFYFIVIFLLMMDLPFQTRNIIDIIMPPIYFNGNTPKIVLSGIIILILTVLLAKEIRKYSERLDTLYIFILLMFFVIPGIGKLSQASNSIMYKLNEGVDSFRIIDQYIFVSNDIDDFFMNVTVNYNVYNLDDRDTSLYIKIPDELQTYFGEEDILITPVPYTKSSSIGTIRERVELPRVGQSVDLSIDQIASAFRKYEMVIKNKESERTWIVIEQ